MEYAYLLKPTPKFVGSLYGHFDKLSAFAKDVCKECQKDCGGFTLTRSGIEYEQQEGPKIGWGFYGDAVFMRIGGCESPAAKKAIEEFLRADGIRLAPGSAAPAE